MLRKEILFSLSSLPVAFLASKAPMLRETRLVSFLMVFATINLFVSIGCYERFAQKNICAIFAWCDVVFFGFIALPGLTYGNTVSTWKFCSTMGWYYEAIAIATPTIQLAHCIILMIILDKTPKGMELVEVQT